MNISINIYIYVKYTIIHLGKKIKEKQKEANIHLICILIN